MNIKRIPLSSRFSWENLRHWKNCKNKLTHQSWKWYCLGMALLLAFLGSGILYRHYSHHKVAVSKEEQLRRLDQLAQPYYEQAQRNIPSAVSRIKLKSLCWYMARDKLSGNHHTERYLNQKLRSVILPCKEMAKVYGVEADSRAFAEITKEVGIDSASSSLCAVGSLALEAVFIRSTLASIKKIAGVALTRMTASLGVGGACAAADGPLPIGDALGVLIAVGGTAWSCYDLYRCPAQLQIQMAASLNSLVEQYREACRKAVLQ